MGVRISGIKMGANQYSSKINAFFSLRNLDPGKSENLTFPLQNQRLHAKKGIRHTARKNLFSYSIYDMTISLRYICTTLNYTSKSYSLRNPCPYGEGTKYAYTLLKLHWFCSICDTRPWRHCCLEEQTPVLVVKEHKC